MDIICFKTKHAVPKLSRRVVKVFVYVCNADFPMESAFFVHFLHFSLHAVYNLLCFLH